MSRLADYFVIVGYHHEKDSEYRRAVAKCGLSKFFYPLDGDDRGVLVFLLKGAEQVVELSCRGFQRKIGQTHHLSRE